MVITLAGASTVVGFESVVPSTPVNFLSSVSTVESNDSFVRRVFLSEIELLLHASGDRSRADQNREQVRGHHVCRRR